ncbi:Uncharacterised protein [Mycobacteroides abscessus subsp. abscessus]|nr:Uncharacterised protein [Mycobacteroides abscessus subsp. abscessus]
MASSAGPRVSAAARAVRMPTATTSSGMEAVNSER